MTTDAASLHAMVRGYMGEGWWPKGLEYVCVMRHVPDGWIWRMGGANPARREPWEAAALIRDAVTEALLAKGDLCFRPTISGRLIVKLMPFDSDDWRGGVYPTRLEALLRAWDAVRGREGK